MKKLLLSFWLLVICYSLFSQENQTPLKDSTTNNAKSNARTISGNRLNIASPSNSLSSLSGRFPGLQVTTATGNFSGGTRLTIRGLRSLLNDNQPLFVVDGIPYSNLDFSTGASGRGGYDMASMAYDLNLYDIDTISILTPNESAIYGYRGTNGVISIKTKHGKYSDSFNIGVNVNSTMSFEKVDIFPKLQKLYGGGSSGNFNTINIGGVDYLTPEYNIDESWGPKYNSNTKVLQWNAYDSWDDANYMKATPWVYPKNDYTSFFETGNGYQNNVSLNGSYKFIAAQVSYTNFQNTGIYPNSKQKRNNISVNSNIKVKQFANLYIGLTYVDNKTTGRPATGYSSNNVVAKMWQFSQTSLDYSALKSYINPDGSQRAWNRVSWNNSTPLYQDNPYWSRYKNVEDDSHNRYFFTTSLQVNIFKWLTGAGRLGIDKYDFDASNQIAVGSADESYYSYDKYSFKESNLDFSFNAFKRFFRNDYGVNAIVGYSTMNNKFEINGAHTNGGLVIPNVYSVSNSNLAATIYGSQFKKKTKSLYTNIELDYKKLVFINLIGREDFMDGKLDFSSNPSKTKSIGISAILSNLEFLKSNRILSYWKVFASQTSYNIDSRTCKYLLQMPNPNLKNETQKISEIGTSISLFKNRLWIDASYYYNVNSDMTIFTPISPATGYDYKQVNIAEIVNKGVEVSISGYPIKSHNIEWSVALNIATLNNKVSSLPEGIDAVELASGALGQSELVACTGYSYPMIYGTDYVYDNKGNRLVSADGHQYIQSDYKPLAKVTPDFTAGFSNVITIKGFSISILVDMQKGGHMYYTSNMLGMSGGLFEETAVINGVDIRESGIVLDGVYGDPGSYSYVDGNGNPSSVPVENSKVITAKEWGQGFYNGPTSQNIFSTDYIKLREVSLAYNVPVKFIHFIKGFRVSVYGRNLAVWGAATKNFDPEYQQMAGSNSQGIEGGYLPSVKTFGFALNMSF